MAGTNDSEIKQWLDAIQLGQYAEIFEKNAITVEILPTLTDRDLEACGIHALGHRKAILQKIEAGRMAVPSGKKTAVKAKAKAGATTVTGGVTGVQSKHHGKWWYRIMNNRFLFISIAAHVLLALGATYYVVQTISAKRKLTFTAAPPSPNPSQRAVEHQVQMAKKQKATSSLPQPKRISTTGVAKVTLPELPMMPSMNSSITPDKMSGMSSSSLGFGSGGMGGGTVGGGSGGGGLFSAFGVSSKNSNSLVGQFYDLKRNRSGSLLNGDKTMTPDKYRDELIKFVKGGWGESFFNQYFKGPKKLYATQIFFPRIDSHEGPKSFGSPNADPPGLWVALYKGQVSPPESGKYHFVAAGDDVMYVKFNGRLVLDNCMYKNEQVNALDKYKYPDFNKKNEQFVDSKFAKSLTVDVKAGEFYDIQVLIGDQVPLDVWAFLLIEKEGAEYKKAPGGAPILPPFRLVREKMPMQPAGGELSPPYDENGPVWQGRAPAAKALP